MCGVLPRQGNICNLSIKVSDDIVFVTNSRVLFETKSLTRNQSMAVLPPEHMAHSEPRQAIRIRGVAMVEERAVCRCIKR